MILFPAEIHDLAHGCEKFPKDGLWGKDLVFIGFLGRTKSC